MPAVFKQERNGTWLDMCRKTISFMKLQRVFEGKKERLQGERKKERKPLNRALSLLMITLQCHVVYHSKVPKQ